MASTKTDIPLAQAQETAQALIDALGDSCERIKVVGSVRRGKATVHDVELLLEPRTQTQVIDLFGTTEHISLFERRYADMERWNIVKPVIGGARLKRFWFREIPCELFICIPPSQWGLAQVIRTGPAEFSHRLVTLRTYGGWLPSGLYVKDLCIHEADGTVIPTPTEEAVFKVLGRDYIEPEARA